MDPNQQPIVQQPQSDPTQMGSEYQQPQIGVVGVQQPQMMQPPPQQMMQPPMEQQQMMQPPMEQQQMMQPPMEQQQMMPPPQQMMPPQQQMMPQQQQPQLQQGGVPQGQQLQGGVQVQQQTQLNKNAKDEGTAMLLAIISLCVGLPGIHRLYLGSYLIGILQLCCSPLIMCVFYLIIMFVWTPLYTIVYTVLIICTLGIFSVIGWIGYLIPLAVFILCIVSVVWVLFDLMKMKELVEEANDKLNGNNEEKQAE